MSYNHDKIKNVLVLMPDKHMGNFVVSLPAINALNKFYSNRQFYLVIDDAYREIIDALDSTYNLILYPRKQIQGSLIQKANSFLKFLFNLKSISPDIAIDLEGRQLSSTLTFLSGAALRIGSSSAKRSFFYNKKINIPRGRHRVNTYLEIASAVGIENIPARCLLKVSEDRKSSLNRILHDNGIMPDMPIVCVHAGAGKIYKQWGLDGFIKISSWLAEKDYQVILIGSKSEAEMNAEIISEIPRNAFNIAGKLTLGELMALFELSSLYLGNDSGPMHLAAAAGAPVVALFGSASEKRWAPLSDKAIILRGSDRCEKCKYQNCQYDYKCVRTISPDDVKTAVLRLINRKKP